MTGSFEHLCARLQEGAFGSAPFLPGTSVPTVFRSGPYRFYFYSHEQREPAHVHVDRDAYTAKFWIKPVSLAFSVGFPPHELGRLTRLVWSHEQELYDAWRDFFTQPG
jgi:hypothetical protein